MQGIERAHKTSATPHGLQHDAHGTSPPPYIGSKIAGVVRIVEGLGLHLSLVRFGRSM